MTMELIRQRRAQQSTENIEYVRTLLRQHQPAFAAALDLAVDLLTE